MMQYDRIHMCHPLWRLIHKLLKYNYVISSIISSLWNQEFDLYTMPHIKCRDVGQYDSEIRMLDRNAAGIWIT